MSIANKAEIDTSAPFRSVKEAVILFGERVLANEVYASKLKEMQDERIEDDNGAMAKHELDETKQTLEKAREESMNMALYLSSLQQELEQTKKELHQIKTCESEKHILLDLEMEDLKFIENSTEQVKREMTSSNDHQKIEFQRKKYVTFANPPIAHQVILPPPNHEVMFQRHPSLKKKKKKPLLPLIGGIFSKIRRSKSSEVSYVA